jgi:hypothetical protein
MWRIRITGLFPFPLKKFELASAGQMLEDCTVLTTQWNGGCIGEGYVQRRSLEMPLRPSFRDVLMQREVGDIGAPLKTPTTVMDAGTHWGCRGLWANEVTFREVENEGND